MIENMEDSLINNNVMNNVENKICQEKWKIEIY